MSNKFLTGKTGGLDDGTADIYVNSVRVNNIAGSQNVKTDSIGELIEGDVSIADVDGLQANLDTKLDNTIAKFKTQATPGIPPVGELRVYKKSDNRLYQLDSNGLENIFAIGAGGGNPFNQNLNTTDSPTFDSLNLTTNNITLGNNLTASNFSTQIGSQGVAPIARGTGNTLIGNDNARDIGINNTVIGSEVLSSGVASGNNIVAIGRGCSQIASLSGNNTVIGFNSAFQGADANSVCIGNLAGNASRVDADCILINADNFPLESTGSNEIRMKAGNTDLFATPLDITYNGSSIKNDDLNSKTQNIIIAETSPGLTKFDGRVNSDYAFSDNGFDHVIYGTDVSSFTPSIFVDNTVFGSQCGVDLGSDNTNIGYSAGALTTGERNTNIGSQAGGKSVSINQGSDTVCVGNLAGGGNLDGSVCIGSEAGNRCGVNSVSIGRQAGASTQSSGAVAIGGLSAQTNQGTGSISIGENTCNVGQGIGSIAIGQNACSTSAQGASSVAIGNLSALTNQGANAVAIGALSAQTDQDAKTIVINADTSGLNTTQENEIRMKAGLSTLDLNQTSGLVVNGQNFTTKIDDLETKTQNIDLVGTTLNNTQLNGNLNMFGNIRMEGTRDIIFGNGSQNTFISALTGILDDRRVRLQNPTQEPVFEICQPNAPETIAFPCSTLILNKNTGGQGGVGLSFYYNGTDLSVPNAGARLNHLCFLFTGSACKFSFFQDNSIRAGNLHYNQGDKAGIGNNGLKILDTTPSTSISSGAIQCSGGVGIAGNLSVQTINNNPVNNYGQFSQLGNLDISLTTTGTEFDLMGSGVGTLTVNAGEMLAGASWHVKLGGTLNTADKEDITFKTYWIDPLAVNPDQLIFDSGAIEIADTAGLNQQWEYEFDYTIRVAGASGTMYSNNQLIYSKAQTENSGRIASKWQSTTGLDMTYNQNWKFTVEWNTSVSSHTIINRMVRIQKVF